MYVHICFECNFCCGSHAVVHMWLDLCIVTVKMLQCSKATIFPRRLEEWHVLEINMAMATCVFATFFIPEWHVEANFLNPFDNRRDEQPFG